MERFDENMERVMRVWRYAAPCGELVLGAYGDRLCMCDWATANCSALFNAEG